VNVPLTETPTAALDVRGILKVDGGFVKKNIKTTFQTVWTDFLTGASAYIPWANTAINGTAAGIAGTANNPGIVRLTSSATANSGYRYQTTTSAFLLAGTEFTNFVFRMPATNAGTTIRMGFHDATTITAPVDGVWINIAGTTLNGKTASNSTSSTTATNYPLVAGTFYSVKIEVNSNATQVTQVNYYLYDSSGTQLWYNNITANIPTATGRETGHGIIATNSGIVAVSLVDIDYVDMGITDALLR